VREERILQALAELNGLARDSIVREEAALAHLHTLRAKLDQIVEGQQPPPNTPGGSLKAGSIGSRLDALEQRQEQILAETEQRLRLQHDYSISHISSLTARVGQLHDAISAEGARLSDLLSAQAEAVAELLDRYDKEVTVPGRNLGAQSESSAPMAEAMLSAVQRLEPAAAHILARSDAILKVTDRIGRTIDAHGRRVALPLGEEVLLLSPDGILLSPIEDTALIAMLLAGGGVLEPATRAAIQELVPASGTFVDVGAHIGTMTIAAARKTGAGGRVIAVEPTPRTARLLKRNIELNGVADRVILHECAAGSAGGHATLYVAPVYGHSSIVPLEGTKSVNVEVARLDDLISPEMPVDVVKIDVEGLELQVWRGMKRIRLDNPLLAAIVEFGAIHLQRSGTTPAEWFGEFLASGLHAFAVGELTGTFRRVGDVSELTENESINILFLHPDHDSYPALSEGGVAIGPPWGSSHLQ
jgi:FkbM family methyltransferase